MKRLLTGVAVLMLAGGAAGVRAEDVTVSTYYPSPRGVYQELRVANNAQLAMQAGAVLIGPNPPAGGERVRIDGSIRVRNNAIIEGVVQVQGGNPGTNKVLISDNNGNATWGFATYAP